MSRFHVIRHTAYLGRVLKVSWQVLDLLIPEAGDRIARRIVASCRDEGMARQIEAHLNGLNPLADHWKHEAETYQAVADELQRHEKRWQATLDHTNNERRLATDSLRRLLDAAIADAGILRNQLFEARDQRDEARAELSGAVRVRNQAIVENNTARASSEANGAEATRAREELRIVRASLDALQSALQSPLGDGRITMPLSSYNNLIDARNQAQAKAATLEKELLELQPLHTYVDGRWLKTS